MGRKLFRIFVWVGVVVVQIILTQVVTFLATLFLGDMENFPQAQPVLFAIVLGITYSIGVFLAGWAGIKLHWLALKPLYLWRLAGALVGAYLPFILALVFFRPLVPGHPSFFISVFTCALGFYVPGWVRRRLAA